MIELPPYVWRSVRSVVRYQIEKLERKASRTSSETSAKYDRNRAANLQVALVAIDEELGRAES